MKDYIHKEFPKTCTPDDFFGQVKRTVNGKPVSQEQIDMIIQSISGGLELNDRDRVFDLGCGNGALSVLMFDQIGSYHGVDFSEFMIGVANKNFSREGFTFEVGEASAYLENVAVDGIYTKALCYGAFSYFEKHSAEKILCLMREKFPNITHFYIGNIPDKERAASFFYDDIDYSELINDTQSAIGIWWSKDDFKSLANKAGWKTEFVHMPESFYAAHYRYDVILSI